MENKERGAYVMEERLRERWFQSKKSEGGMARGNYMYEGTEGCRGMSGADKI